jgi:hypothetical protein
MVENESARGVGSIALKFWPTLEHRQEGSGLNNLGPGLMAVHSLFNKVAISGVNVLRQGTTKT